ncbi:MAG TPA: TolC family protein [Polyangia bacterium]|jgi:outer membrane protein TolC
MLSLAFGLCAAQARAAEPASQPSASVVKVTWQQALDRAAARNTSTLVAAQEIARADALVREARAGWLPTLIGNGSYTRLDAARTFGGTVTTPANLWNGNLALTVPIVSPPAWANDWHAQDNRAVATAAAADARRQLAMAVGRTYLTVLLEHREMEVSMRARDTAQAHYEYAHTRLSLGLGNGVDDARAEQELRSDEALLKDAETALVRAQSALATLLSEEDLVDAIDDVNLATVPTAEAAVDDARHRRSDVRALEARREATQHLRRDDWVYYAPALLAQAQAFKQSATPLQPGSGWQAALVLSIPFYDGGLRYGIGHEREALDQEARIQLDAALRQVSVEVRTAFRIVANADQSLGSARAASTAAGTAAVLADKAYKGGATTNLEVIDAERRARDADSQVALSEDAARQARLDLLLATGAFP